MASEETGSEVTPCPRCLAPLEELVCTQCGTDYSVLAGTPGFAATSTDPLPAEEGAGVGAGVGTEDEPLVAPDGADFDWGAKVSEELSKGVLTGSMKITGDGPEPAERIMCLTDHEKFCCARHKTHTSPHRMCLMRGRG